MDELTLKQFLKAGFEYNRYLNPTTAGTPQVGIISPILANMTLDGLELDHIVWGMLWRLAKRRHPDKEFRTWVANRYWHSDGTWNSGVFYRKEWIETIPGHEDCLVCRLEIG